MWRSKTVQVEEIEQKEEAQELTVGFLRRLCEECKELEPGSFKDYPFSDISLDWVGSHLVEIGSALNGSDGYRFFVFLSQTHFRVLHGECPPAKCA